MTFDNNLERIRRDMNRMLERLWDERGINKVTPAMDMFRENGNLVVEMDMPGINKDDIGLKVTENGLSVSAEKRELKEGEEKGFYRYERSWSRYERNIAFPVRVNPDEVNAKYENGTLRVKVSLAEKEEEKKRVKVS